MKLRSLRLLAFGPFTGQELRFAGEGVPAHPLHVVLGANEAGKSTTLRAISGVLFGIPAQTRDAHVHRMADLRIGAVLEAADGTVLEIVRRKGTKNTLLDAAGRPIDEAVLQRLCGATTEAAFRALFGLDHESLRAGGEALLRGGGDLGESLFDAALGGIGRGIHAVLKSIDEEARALFLPQAQKPALNEALRQFQELRRLVKERASSGDAWVAQQRGLEEARQHLIRLTESLRAARLDLSALQRTQRLLPLVAQWGHLQEQLRQLGDVVALPAEATQARVTAQGVCDQAEAERLRIAAELDQARTRLATLVVPGWFDLPIAATLAELRSQLGAHEKAAADRPRLLGQLAALEEEARARAHALPASLAAAGARPGMEVHGRIRELALREGSVREGQRGAARTVATLQRRRAEAAARVAALPPAADPRVATVTVRRLLRDRDLEDALDQARRRERKLQDQCDSLRAALRPLGALPASATALQDLPLPGDEAIERCALAVRELVEHARRLEEQAAAIDQRLREIDDAQARHQGPEQLPTLGHLTLARRDRDARWQALRAADRATTAWEQAAAAFTAAAAQVDQITDRLLQAADRVAQAAALAREHDELRTRREALAGRRAAVAAQRQQDEAAWSALWQAAGIAPEPPEPMRARLRQLERLRSGAAELDAAAGARAELADRVDRSRAELAQVLGTPAGDRDLRTLGDAAEALVETLEARHAERAALLRDLARLDQELADAQDAHAAASADLDQWQQEWTVAVGPIGLLATATATEATAVLGALQELERKQDEITDKQRRVQAIDRDAEQFSHAVRALTQAIAPELDGAPATAAAAELAARHEHAGKVAVMRQQCQAEIERLERSGQQAQARRERAERQLAALLRAARIPRPSPAEAPSAAELAALETAETHAREAARLRDRLADIEAQILAAGDGLTLAAAVSDAHAADAEALAARVDARREEIDALDTEVRRANHKLGELDEGLKTLKAKDGGDVAELAAEASSEQARVRALAEDCARLRLASVLLTRTLEHYRDQHQGPVLLRAATLFTRLTGERYTGLRADLDDSDQPVLRCLRKDGAKVAVDELSDGARDQVYLALRLASLEQQARGGEPLPLVLDDVLVHFDDERAEAALRVLADHARTTQVILFTHHARVVELARHALSPDQLLVVDWQPAAGTAPA